MLNARRSALLRSLKKPLLLLSLVGVPLTAAGLVSGCGGDGTSGGGTCFDYTSFTANTNAAFKADVLPIFQRSCGLSTACHQLQMAPAPAQHFLGPAMGTAVDATQIAAIRAQSIGVASVDNPDMQIINPGHPETSFLMFKLDDTLECEKLTCASKMTCLGKMPQNSATLSEAERNTIRSWIKNGALDN